MSNKVIFLGLVIYSLTLAACGGGSDNSLPSPPLVLIDDTRPLVLSTKPSSEELGWPTIKPVKITFNEPIDIVPTYQIAVEHLFENDVAVVDNVLQEFTLAYEKSNNSDDSDILVVSFVAGLKLNSQYRVTVSGIKDLAGNVLLEDCAWDFTTGTAKFNLGNTALCGKNPSTLQPDKPRDIQAFIIDQLTTAVTWNSPDNKLGGVPTFYTIERATTANLGDKKFFTILSGNNRNRAYIDTYRIQPGLMIAYRVTAGNAAGTSSALSNTFVAQADAIIFKPNEVIPSVPFDRSNAIPTAFGDNLEFSFDGKILAVGEKLGNKAGIIDTTTILTAGSVRLYTKQNGSWKNTSTLYSSFPAKFNEFGASLAFSSDGTLAVGEIKGGASRAGTVQLFKQGKDGCSLIETLESNTPVVNNSFGSSLAFNSDGSILAVGEPFSDDINYTDSGTVQIFTKNQNIWNLTPIAILNSSLESDLTNGHFGLKLVFGANDTLAVSELDSNFNSEKNVGAVHLFNQGQNGVWLTTKILRSIVPAASNRFGSNLAVSANGSNLAIAERQGDIVGNSDIGTVHLYSINSKRVWVYVTTISSVRNNQNFGATLAFNSNDSLVVAQTSNYLSPTSVQGSAELFSKTTSGWSYILTLNSNVTNTHRQVFGRSMAISSDGTLAVGELLGEIMTNTIDGAVSIFDLNNFVK